MNESVTVEQLVAKMRHLRQRVEDLEDGHDLESDPGKPGRTADPLGDRKERSGIVIRLNDLGTPGSRTNVVGPPGRDRVT